MRLLILFALFIFSLSGFSQKRSVMNFQTRTLVQDMAATETKRVFIRGKAGEILNYCLNNDVKTKASFFDYVLADLRKEQIIQLSTLDFVEGFEFDWNKQHLLLDSALIQNNVDSVHQGMGLNVPYTGKDIIIGVVDTGLDVNHGDFKNLDGSTRILEVWDQTLPFDAAQTPPFGYGQAFDSSEINAGTILHVDENRHGTQVAAMAASNGLLVGDYKGIAPEADLLIVELDFTGANANASVDAWQWLFDKADEYGKPIVINASYGDYLGSHDGLDARALYLDSILGAQAGRLFVCAGGNSGHVPNYHVRHNVSGDTVYTSYSLNPSSDVGNTVFFDVWSDTADFNQMSISISANNVSSGEERGKLNFLNVINDGLLGVTKRDSIMNGPNKLSNVEIYTESRGEQYNFQVYIENPDSLYNYSLITTGIGQLDLWSGSWLGVLFGNDVVMLSDPMTMAGPAGPTYSYVVADSLMSVVSSFSCSENVVTVANYVCQEHYIDFDGVARNGNNPAGVLHKSSSKGPTRDGRIKPNISSTGGYTMSAIPIDKAIAWQTSNSNKLSQDGFHALNGGTSMASPCVAGIGALLLEKCSNLTQEEFRNIIQSTASQDANSLSLGPLPNNAYGYGKANATRAVTSTNVSAIISGDLGFCQGELTSIQGPIGWDEYYWSNGDSASVLAVSVPGNFSFSGRDEYGCASDTLNFTVIENPAVSISNISQIDDTLFVTSSDMIQWYWNSTAISGQTDSVLLLTQGGDYFAIASNSFGCTAVSDTVNFIPANVTSSDKIFNIYPNPTSSYLDIKSSSKIDQIVIRDVNGKLINSVINSVNNRTVDVSTLENGIYFLDLIINDRKETFKFQVIK